MKNDIWINLFLFFLVTDKPETVLDLMQSDNCEEEFTDIIQKIVTMDSKQFQHTCTNWLMKHREKLMELNKVYRTSQKEIVKEPVTPKGVTVTDFADRCRECGAEYGKILESMKPKGGHWASSSNGWMCSNCRKDAPHEFDFCPNCGADMRETRESEKNYISEE